MLQHINEKSVEIEGKAIIKSIARVKKRQAKGNSYYFVKASIFAI
jgi:hypothetical protein